MRETKGVEEIGAMKLPSKRDILSELDDTLLFADGLDDAIIGTVAIADRQDVVLYDRKKAVSILMKDGMGHNEAEEYFEFNTQCAYVGKRTPAFATFL